MTIPQSERRRMLRARSIGPKMISYLEMTGITRLEDLHHCDPEDLAFRINAELGRNHINRAGIAALTNLVALANIEK